MKGIFLITIGHANMWNHKRGEFVIIDILFVLYLCMTQCLFLNVLNKFKSEKEYGV